MLKNCLLTLTIGKGKKHFSIFNYFFHVLGTKLQAEILSENQNSKFGLSKN